MRAAAAAVLVAATVARAQTPALSDAEAEFAKLQFAQAARALEKAEAATGNDRPTLLRIYELKGIVLATLNRGPPAIEAFKKLLVLDPEHKLSRSYAPRVTTPYYEAQAWASSQPSMKLEEGSVARSKGVVSRVSVLITADPLKLARAVRFHVREGDGPWQAIDRPLDVSRSASVQPRFAHGAYWAEALGARDAVLITLGDEAHPIALEGVRPSDAPRVTEAPKPAPAEPAIAPAEGVSAAAPASEPRFRPAAWGALAGAVAAGGAGVYFAVASQSARNQFTQAQRDGEGTITGITQRQAVQLDATARTDAIVGNACLVAAGVLAAASVTLFAVGSKLRVAAGPSAVSVSGDLP